MDKVLPMTGIILVIYRTTGAAMEAVIMKRVVIENGAKELSVFLPLVLSKEIIT